MKLRLLTWNIHGARDASLERIAEEIAAQRADVVCLNEVRRHDGKRLGNALQMRSFVASSPIGPYGNAIFTNEPAATWRSMHFDVVRRVDRRDAAVVTLPSGVTIAAVHLNLRAEERTRNARQLVDALPERSIVAGDLNEPPRGRVWHILAERFSDACAAVDVPTYPADTPNQRIDFIWVPPDTHVEETDVVPTASSDHRAIVLTVSIPQPESSSRRSSTGK